MPPRIHFHCTVYGCKDPHVGFGFCSKHYFRRYRPPPTRPPCEEYEGEFPRTTISSFTDLLHQLKSDLASGRKRRVIEWDLVIDDLIVLTQQPCWYCGALPANKMRRRHRRTLAAGVVREYHHNLNWNGLDRVDNSRGYTVDNVVTCCATCNRAKGTMTAGEFLAWAEQLSLTAGF
jgi:5-methylcytosine-specific restriction endonuclease McrA